MKNLESKPVQLTLDQRVDKYRSEREHLYFTRLFFQARQSNNFKVNWHHHIIADHLEKVITGEIKNLVINVSPGSSKTELAVVNFIARGMALNPRARFLHLSYSDDLALLNSSTARDLISSEEYQTLWPMRIADDSKSKKRWNVVLHGKSAGGVYATSLGGQITGFRAGNMAPGFQGALIVDDPIKPEDAFSESKIKVANRRLLTTVKSRLANPDTPIIVIMQRVGEEDPTGFIKQGNLGKHWTHLVIPAVITEQYVAQLCEKYQKMIERDAKDRFSYWPYKERIEDLLAMERGEGTNAEGARVSRHVFTSQYQQDPKAIGGNIIHGKELIKYAVRPKIRYRIVTVDTAQKTKERNDYSVLACWGYGIDDRIYLLDLIRGKWEAPELESRTIAFWAKHKAEDVETLGTLRRMYVEDKASGTGLIQKIKLSNQIPIKAVERNIDKLTRVMDILGYIQSGLVCVPEDAPFTLDFISECEAFTADDSHMFDDQVDTMVDAIDIMLSTKNKLKTWNKLGKDQKTEEDAVQTRLKENPGYAILAQFKN